LAVIIIELRRSYFPKPEGLRVRASLVEETGVPGEKLHRK
jgi:hypothetical protein